MHIDSLDMEPFAELRYMNARSGGGSEVSRLSVLRARLSARLADELDAIVCCSDLQGIVSGELLGVAVVDLLVQLADDGVLPPSARTGIVLAGDLYSVPGADQRGGFGDVAAVWQAFADVFPWVVGVAGNHDDVANVIGMADHVHVLDGSSVVVDGLRIGGVGRIMGNPRKPGRRTEEEQLSRISAVIDHECDLIVMHEGPNGAENQTGHPSIRELLDAGTRAFTVCGHRHWSDPLAVREHGQILNVDARVVVLQAD
jgi:3',5'-cyclic-AMP phosphodiesterase